MIQGLHALIQKALLFMRGEVAGVAAGLLVRPFGDDLGLLPLNSQVWQEHGGKLAALSRREFQFPSSVPFRVLVRPIGRDIKEGTSLEHILDIFQDWLDRIGDVDRAAVGRIVPIWSAHCAFGNREAAVSIPETSKP